MFTKEEFQQKPIKSFILFGIVLVLIFFIVFSAVFMFQMRGNRTKMPDIRGKNILESLELLQKSGLHRYYIIQESSTKYPKYEVLNQKPSPGFTISKKRLVKLTVSQGTYDSVMPSLMKLELSEAKKRIYDLFSKYKKIPDIVYNYQFSDTIKRGHIIRHQPKPKQNFNEEVSFLLIISRGIGNNDIKIENYRYQNYQKILDELTEANINVEINSVLVNNSIYLGKILSQSISPGKVIKPSDTISFVVGSSVAKESDGEINFIYRVLETSIPYPNSFYDLNSKKTKLRSIKIVINDDLGESIQFRDSVLSGDFISIPYRTKGNGEVRLIIDGEFYKKWFF